MDKNSTLTRPKGFTIIIPKDKTIHDFIDESNKHIISKEFLEKCNEVSKLFKCK